MTRRLLIFSSLFISLFLAGTQAHANPTAATLCENGMAGIFPCHNVHLLAHLSLSQMGGTEGVKGSEHWGWTDPETGNQYVIFGMSDQAAFVDITDPLNPIYLGSLPGHDLPSNYRDMKVYGNYAYITADAPALNHGIQIFDLTQLRNVSNPPITFTETNHYAELGNAHTLWVNHDTGYMYALRSNTCSAGIHIISLADPANPTFAGCAATDDAPMSDTECVLYHGPDTDYTGRELCFTGSDDDMGIDDVTDKANPQIVARFGYPGIHRAHQGSLTPDHHYWVMSDMHDEMHMGHNTRTYFFDLTDLDAPLYLGYYEHNSTAMDHDLYIIGNLLYEANWQAGLRIFDLSGLPSLELTELGYFDVVPDGDSVAMTGAWTNYPWWRDGVVTLSDNEAGLYVVQYNPDTPTSVGLSQITGTASSLPLLLALLLLLLATAFHVYHPSKG